MTANQKSTDPGGSNSPWLGFVKFLLVVVLTLMLFLLGRSMQRHHFFDGGQMNRHDAARP